MCLWTISTGIIWYLIRNSESQALPRPTDSKSAFEKISKWFTEHYSLRTTVLWEIDSANRCPNSDKWLITSQKGSGVRDEMSHYTHNFYPTTTSKLVPPAIAFLCKVSMFSSVWSHKNETFLVPTHIITCLILFPHFMFSLFSLPTNVFNQLDTLLTENT